MPHLNDASINNIWDGNNGEKWQVVEGTESEDEMFRKWKKIKVVEELIKET